VIDVRIALLAATVAAFGLAAPAGAAEIAGAGATFPYPVYAKWAEAYKAKTGTSMNYQSIGSGGGIAQISAKTVDIPRLLMMVSACENQGRSHYHSNK